MAPKWVPPVDPYAVYSRAKQESLCESYEKKQVRVSETNNKSTTMVPNHVQQAYMSVELEYPQYLWNPQMDAGPCPPQCR